MRFIGIDPSTKTGFVALDENGQVLRAKELTGIGDKDPYRMITLIDEVMAHMQRATSLQLRDLDLQHSKAYNLVGLVGA